MKRLWTNEDDKYLALNCQLLTYKEIAANLQRTETSVRLRVSRLNLSTRTYHSRGTNSELRVCSKCNTAKLRTEFYPHPKTKDRLQPSCKECCNQTSSVYQKDCRKDLKQEVFEAYGGVICACCGETLIDCLNLDHINGGGNRHRRLAGGSYRVYRELKDKGFPPGYQVLCFNCNFMKYKNGHCLHGRV